VSDVVTPLQRTPRREYSRVWSIITIRELKVHPTSIARADDVMSKHAGTLLVPPLSEERAKALPAFIAKDIHIEGTLFFIIIINNKNFEIDSIYCCYLLIDFIFVVQPMRSVAASRSRSPTSCSRGSAGPRS
jgi:hypothetical protein